MIRNYLIALSLLLFIASNIVDAQPPITTEKKPALNVGFGVGLDYGGIGLRFTGTPVKYIGVFGCFGYAITGPGYNFGLNLRTLPDKRVCPYLTAMYGYNAVIGVKGAPEFDKMYFGPSYGGGLEIWDRKFKGYFNLELLFPDRPIAYDNDLNALQHNPHIVMGKIPPDFAISIGYHIGIKSH